MSSRGLWVKLGQHSLRSTTVLTLVATLLVVAGAAGLRKVVATRAANSASTSVSVSREAGRTVGASSLMAGTANGQKVIGVFEGKFDAKTQTVTLLNSSSGNLKATYKAFGRSDATTPLPEGSYTRTFVKSCATPSGTVPCQSTAPANTVSGEMRIDNTGSRKFYNTRLIFTDFLDARGGVPITANAYFNDGQVALNGKLGVSRDYGDIDSSASQTRVWTFAFPTTSLTSFYFRYTMVADIGVATESVEPAAVQNNIDRTITINGQGFNSPTVTLLNASGAVVATLSSTVVLATQLTATVPAGTAAGIYGVQVTNTGGTAGGVGSSTLIGRLSVTGVPDGAHTLSGTITSWGDTGPYRISGAATISGAIPAGTVIYVDNGVNLQVGASLTANGGIPGVPTTSPAQIVFTRSPGATSWGGLDATSASSSEVTLRNCVIEFGGNAGGAQVNISGSGRTLRFTDSISRRSGGDGLRAAGSGDFFTGFTRSRIENNGGIAILLSANAALGVGTTGGGMGDLDSGNANTRVPDQGYYFSAANVIRNNVTNAVQIDANANDFTRSGVLVGQGDIPIQIRGGSGNPSIVGNSNGSPGAELTINPTALIQLDAGLDLMAGNGTLFGNIAANGYAGYSQSPSPDTGISQRIVFDKIPGGGNFGALFFSPTSAGSSILNFASIRNGGSSPSGNAQVVIGSITYPFSFTNSESTNSSSYGLQFRSSTTVTRTNTNYSNNGTGNENIVSTDPTITTVAGGLYGDGNQANQAPLIRTIATAVDPGRGIYVAETNPTNAWFIRYINTTNSPVKIAGITVPANGIRNLTSGRFNVSIVIPDNTPMGDIDLLGITGIALSGDRNVLFFTNTDGSSTKMVNWINVTPGADTGTSPIKWNPSAPTGVDVGNVGTLYNDTTGQLSGNLRGMVVSPTASKTVYVADGDKFKVVQITPAGVLSTFAGGVDRPRGGAFQTFSAGAATSTLIGLPETIAVSGDGSVVYITDNFYGRVIRVQSNSASLVAQYGVLNVSTLDNPMPSGLALLNGSLYVANASNHTVVRVDNPDTVNPSTTPSGNGVIVSGAAGTLCDYSAGSCGDGGAIASMTYDLRGGRTNLGSDSNGLFVVDQVGISTNRPRIRYLNLSGGNVTLANVTVGASNGNTIAGSGLASPYDGGLATSAIFNTTTGVAVDNNGNLFISDSALSDSALRFVNRGASSVTLLGQTVAPGAILRINPNSAPAAGGSDESTSPSTSSFYSLQGLKWTSEGLYIVDSGGKVAAAQGLRTSRLRFLNLSSSPVTFFGSVTVNPGNIVTLAGANPTPGSPPADGVAANLATLIGTTDVEIDPTTKDIYLSEAFAGSTRNAANRRVRKILRSTGIISSVLTSTTQDYTGLAFDNSGRLLVAAVATSGSQVLRETGVGTGTFAAVTSSIVINRPRDIAVDSSNNLYVMNSGTHVILRLPVDGGMATSFAGTSGTAGFAGDGGLPASARISIDPETVATVAIETSSPNGVFAGMIQTASIVVSPSGEVIFADAANARVRRIQ